MADDTNTGKTIDEVTEDTNIGGAEKLPVSDAGSPKSVTVTGIKNFVVAAIEELTAVSAADIENDSIYVKSGSNMKRMTATMLADAIFAYLHGKDNVTVNNLADTDVVSLKKGTDEKTTTIGAIKGYIVNNFRIDIDALTTASLAMKDTDEMAIAQSSVVEGVTVWDTVKCAVSTLASHIFSKIKNFTTGTTAIGNDDKLMVLRKDANGNYSNELVTFSNSGLGKGNVSVSGATTEDYIPQWSSTSGQLVNGLELTGDITSSSTSSQIPNAAAVYSKFTSVVTGPQTSTNGNIPQFSGTSGNSLSAGLSVKTSMSATPSDSNVLTEKAVSDSLSGKVDEKNETKTDGNVPKWDNGKLANGYTLKSDDVINGVSTHSQIPTAHTIWSAYNRCPQCYDSNASATAGKFLRYTDTTSTTLMPHVAGDIGLTDYVNSMSSHNDVPSAYAVYVAATSVQNSCVERPSLSVRLGTIPTWSGARQLDSRLDIASHNLQETHTSDTYIPTTYYMEDRIKAHPLYDYTVQYKTDLPPSSVQPDGEVYFITATKQLVMAYGSTWYLVSTLSLLN